MIDGDGTLQYVCIFVTTYATYMYMQGRIRAGGGLWGLRPRVTKGAPKKGEKGKEKERKRGKKPKKID